MLKPLWLHLDALAARMREVRGLSVGCDFDGTLTEIEPHPDQAELVTRAFAVLEHLAAMPGVRLGIFSGRRLEDLRARIPFPGVFLAGTAGLETFDGNGSSHLHVSEAEALPSELVGAMTEWCTRFEGAWLEDKGPAFALHYRAVPDRFQPAFCSGVRRRFGGEGSKARLLHGKKVFEVLPAVERDKSSAYLDWVLEPEKNLTFYFGDDTHDEPVYPHVRTQGGIAVAIGRFASRAEYALAGPPHVTWFLEWLAREWMDARNETREPEREEAPARAIESESGSSV